MSTKQHIQLWVLNVSFSNKRDFLLWLPEKVTAQQQHNSFSSGKSTSARLWGTRVCLQFLRLMIFPLCMCVVQFFLRCFFKSIFIVETKTNSVVWEIFHRRFFALVALHFQKCQAVLCYILIDMLEKVFCSNIAPFLGGTTYLNQVWAITFDWSALY